MDPIRECDRIVGATRTRRWADCRLKGLSGQSQLMNSSSEVLDSRGQLRAHASSPEAGERQIDGQPSAEE